MSLSSIALNTIQKMTVVLAALLSVYFVFITPPRITRGLNDVVVDTKYYCANGKNTVDCEAAIINIPQLMVYLAVILGVTPVMLLVFAEKKVSR